MAKLFNLIKGASDAGGDNQALMQKVDALGRSALHFSAAKGAATTTRLLLDMGLKPYQLDKQRNTPLHLAGKAMMFSMVRHVPLSRWKGVHVPRILMQSVITLSLLDC